MPARRRLLFVCLVPMAAIWSCCAIANADRTTADFRLAIDRMTYSGIFDQKTEITIDRPGDIHCFIDMTFNAYRDLPNEIYRLECDELALRHQVGALLADVTITPRLTGSERILDIGYDRDRGAMRFDDLVFDVSVATQFGEGMTSVASELTFSKRTIFARDYVFAKSELRSPKPVGLNISAFDFYNTEMFLQNRTRISPGDADADGDVDFADFLILANNFGKRGSPIHGKFAGNGRVGFPDFLMMRDVFGQTSDDAATAAVPEPSSRYVVMFCVLLALSRCRQRRR